MRAMTIQSAIIALLVASSWAVAAEDKQVTASGTATITAPPEILRVTVILKVEGKDVKDALGKLSAEKKLAKDKLAKLDAPADAMKFTDPTMGDKPLTMQQRQMRMVMAMQNRGGGKKPTTGPSNVDVATTLVCDLPLKYANADEMLIAVAEVQAKLRESFKAGGGKSAGTPEEQEVLEEMQAAENASGGGDPSAAKPGEPSFLFVHRVTEAEQNKVLADAFAQAKQSAQRLAKAAGIELGELKTLSASRTTAGPGESDGQWTFYTPMASGPSPASDSSATFEATGPQAGPVSSRVTVNAGFGLR